MDACLRVLVGIGLGWIAMAAFVVPVLLLTGDQMATLPPASAVGWAWVWPAVALAGVIGAGAVLRPMSEGIDGADQPVATAHDLVRGIGSNTAEQAVIFALATGALAALGPGLAWTDASCPRGLVPPHPALVRVGLPAT